MCIMTNAQAIDSPLLAGEAGGCHPFRGSTAPGSEGVPTLQPSRNFEKKMASEFSGARKKFWAEDVFAEGYAVAFADIRKETMKWRYREEELETERGRPWCYEERHGLPVARIEDVRREAARHAEFQRP